MPMLDIQLIEPPADDAALALVSVADMKLHLRIGNTKSDATIEASIREAVAALDGPLGTLNRIILPSTWRIFRSSFPLLGAEIALPFPPLTSVVSIGYDDGASPSPTIDAADYVVIPGDYGSTIRLKTGRWPVLDDPYARAVGVTFRAGYAPASAPHHLKRLIKLLAADFYENREGTINDRGAAMENRKIAYGVDWLTKLLKVPNSYDDWNWVE